MKNVIILNYNHLYTQWSTHIKRIGVILMLALCVMMVAAPQVFAARYAALIVRADNGEVLTQRDPHRRVYPASLTKVMTLFMVFEALQEKKITLNTKLVVSKRAAGQTPTKIGFKQGEKIPLDVLIMSLIVRSANDAAVVVAEKLGNGSEQKFAGMMTKRARKLGMRRTTFKNASGLPNRGQVTTAHDMVLLGRELIRKFPSYYKLFSTRSFKFRGRTYKSHNNLLKKNKYIDGIKTGYIRASGYNVLTSINKPGSPRLIGVVFGGRSAPSRDKQMGRLLTKGYNNLKQNRLASVQEPQHADRPTPSLFANSAQSRIIQQPASRPVAKAYPAIINSNARLSVNNSALEAKGAQGHLNTALGETWSNNTNLLKAYAKLKQPKATNEQDTKKKGKSIWSIQVGAFRSKKDAQNANIRASGILGSIGKLLRPSVHKIVNRKLYRARLKGLKYTSAKTACKILQKNKMDCLVVQSVQG